MNYLIVFALLAIVFYFVFRQYHKLQQFGSGEETLDHSEVSGHTTYGSGGNYQPPQPKTKGPYDGRIIDINQRHYQRILLVKGSNLSYLTDMITEFGSLSGNTQFEEHVFRIAQKGDWHVIVFDERSSFFFYHNLVGWLYGYEDNMNVPGYLVGYAIHKFNQQRSYLFYLDPNISAGDTAIGALESGESFFIYFPDSYHENGNMAITTDVQVSMTDNKKRLSEYGFELTDIGHLDYTDHRIKIYD